MDDIPTRWHSDDRAGRILREAKTNGQRGREVRLPARAEENDPLGRAPDEPLWPEMYTREHLERRRDSLTPYFWMCLYQQNPNVPAATRCGSSSSLLKTVGQVSNVPGLPGIKHD